MKVTSISSAYPQYDKTYNYQEGDRFNYHDKSYEVIKPIMCGDELIVKNDRTNQGNNIEL